jgi:hypothetical protein
MLIDCVGSHGSVHGVFLCNRRIGGSGMAIQRQYRKRDRLDGQPRK